MNKIENNSKRILLTGGTEGIGRSIVDQFLSVDTEESFILTCSRHGDKNKELNDLDSTKIEALTIDLGDKKQVAQLVEKSIEHEINTIVLNATVTGIEAVDRQIYSDEYVRTVNEYSPIEIINRMLPFIRSQKPLVIFVSSSMTDLEIVPEEAKLYVETKRNIEKQFHEIALREENRAVTFLIIDPGPVETRMHENVLNFTKTNSSLYKRTLDLFKMKKLRDSETIGKIFYNIINSRSLFDPITRKYDVPLDSGEKYKISEEEYQFFKEN